jgi:hypothetical protein
VFRRFAHGLLIVAVLATAGGHWAVLQSVAWTTMLADNLRTTSFCDAVKQTFDGKHPCGLCKQINQGRQTEKKSEAPLELKKLEFSYAPAVFAFSPPAAFRELRPGNDSAVPLIYPPPVPPPRSLLG